MPGDGGLGQGRKGCSQGYVVIQGSLNERETAGQSDTFPLKYLRDAQQARKTQERICFDDGAPTDRHLDFTKCATRQKSQERHLGKQNKNTSALGQPELTKFIACPTKTKSTASCQDRGVCDKTTRHGQAYYMLEHLRISHSLKQKCLRQDT